MTHMPATALVLTVLLATPAVAATVTMPPKSEPESITIAPNGDLILGSATMPKIFRAKGATGAAEVFIDASNDGDVYFLGVLADSATNTLWACQLQKTPPGAARHTTLRSFDLTSGEPKYRWDLPGEQNLCNDFTIGPDKALYVSDTFGSKIWRLKPGASEPELLIEDRALYGIDGITFLGDTLYVNNVFSNNLYRVPLDASGKASRPVDIWMDRPVKGPDGMRAANGRLFNTENGAGKIEMITVNGDTAHVEVLKEGLGTPTAIEPHGNTLWFGERSNDRAGSMPLPR